MVKKYRLALSIFALFTLLLGLPVVAPVFAKDSINYESAQCKGFLAEITRKLNNNWFIPDGNNRVTITATVESDGSAVDVKTSSSPSSAEAENAANAAYVKAQPFGALPVSAGEKAKLTIEFVSNADPHGDSSRNIHATLGPLAAK